MAAPYRFLFILLPVLALAVIVVSLPRTAPAPEAEPKPVPTPDLVYIPTEAERAFEQELEEIAASLDGTVGIAVTDVTTDRNYAIAGDEWFPQQSVSKIWVTLTALDEVDRGRLELDERVTIGPKDLTLFHQPIRNLVRARGSFSTDYADLIRRAITRSDNTANDRILRRVGGAEAVEGFLDEKGIAGVRFGADERSKQSAIAGLRWNQAYSVGNAFFDARDQVHEAARRAAFEGYLADPIDGATPVGITQALAALTRGELLSPSSTALIMATLGQTRSGPQRLKAGVPPGWSFGHKTGTGQFFDGEQSGYNDIGIMTSPDGRRYTLAVMIARTREPTLARMRMMQEVSQATAQFDLERAADTAPEVVAQPVG
ncbi:MAG: class A beta-lactamase-related serine hydrolase [Erythrobacter sp.]|nr:class A beta-lactamase-related serine hydrolase [Erythrobacter sp.]